MTSLDDSVIQPGSHGEHEMQKSFNTQKQAQSFYKRQMLDFLAPLMQTFIIKQEMVFISTSDSHGECDCSLRTGEAGFIIVIDEHTLAYPDYKGNGVLASTGNLSENPHMGLLFIDFFEDKVGLHVNGKAKMIDNEALMTRLQTSMLKDKSLEDLSLGKKCMFWTLIEVEEAYIHCSKNIPMFEKTNEDKLNGKSCAVDYFELQELDKS